jgi:hypothetical protein
VQWLDGDDSGRDDVLAFRRGPAGGGVVCLVNTGSAPIDLPDALRDAAVLLASRPLARAPQLAESDGTASTHPARSLPGDTAVWLAEPTG